MRNQTCQLLGHDWHDGLVGNTLTPLNVCLRCCHFGYSPKFTDQFLEAQSKLAENMFESISKIVKEGNDG